MAVDQQQEPEEAEAKQVAEQVAEATLLVLGTVLEWKADEQAPDRRLFAFTPTDDMGSYEVLRENDWMLFHQRVRYTAAYFTEHEVPVSACLHNFDTLVAAIAACERHHATGRWE